MRVAYFVHDLTDPAVSKRVRMLTAGGAEVTVLGFRRLDGVPGQVESARTVDLGRTYDGGMLQRTLMVATRAMLLGPWAGALEGTEIVMARNLEMLVIATQVRRRCAPQARLVYECLDIHRLLLAHGVVGTSLRALERRLMWRAHLLIVSSPAFVKKYFEPKHGVNRAAGPRVLLVENKVLDIAPPGSPVSDGPRMELPAGPPWRIGWFGMIRCRKSLEALCGLAARRPGLLQVVVRGRPSRAAFDDFDAQIGNTHGVSYEGSYDVRELAGMYGQVHFNWAVDYYEEGANSTWLLPNRIYEGGCHGAVPIAASQTETGLWLWRLGIGAMLDSPLKELESFLEGLNAARYLELKNASLAAPHNCFVADQDDCKQLLQDLAATDSGEGRPRRLSLEAG